MLFWYKVVLHSSSMPLVLWPMLFTVQSSLPNFYSSNLLCTVVCSGRCPSAPPDSTLVHSNHHRHSTAPSAPTDRLALQYDGPSPPSLSATPPMGALHMMQCFVETYHIASHTDARRKCVAPCDILYTILLQLNSTAE